MGSMVLGDGGLGVPVLCVVVEGGEGQRLGHRDGLEEGGALLLLDLELELLQELKEEIRKESECILRN